MDLIFYNGEHAATFGDKHSWNDWHLIPTSKPVISPPNVKIKTVDIPGAHGIIDLSSVLTGYPLYENRTGNLDFVLAPGFEYWENAKTIIMDYLQGRTMNLYLSDDPDHYWTGMFYVNQLKSDARTNGITIAYDLYPFKRDIIKSDDDWLWDPFNFEIGVIRSWSALVVDGSLTVTVEDCVEPVRPIFTPTAAMTLKHTWTLPDGTTKSKTASLTANTGNTPTTLRPGKNALLFTGNGNVKISYRGGRL